jgi:hypothetical protein
MSMLPLLISAKLWGVDAVRVGFGIFELDKPGFGKGGLLELGHGGTRGRDGRRLHDTPEDNFRVERFILQACAVVSPARFSHLYRN